MRMFCKISITNLHNQVKSELLSEMKFVFQIYV